MIQLRKAHASLSTGDFRLVEAEHPAVLAYWRSQGADDMLVVNNLSESPVRAQLDAPGGHGKVPVHFGGTALPGRQSAGSAT